MPTNTDPFIPTAAGTVAGYDPENTYQFLKGIKDATIDAFSLGRISKYFLTLEESAKSLNTKLGAGLESSAEMYRKKLSNIYLNNLEFGFKYDDAGKLLGGLSTQMERMIPFSETITANALKLGMSLGETPEAMGKLIGDMTKYGLSQEKSLTVLNKTFATARAYGVDAKKLTATVSANIKMAATYGFKNGIEGLTKMAAQAQRLGMDIKKTQGFADSILEGGIEEAVKVSTELQMLGGSNGALANAESLYYMSLYDVEGLQTELAKANQSAVEFNETTGEFKITGENALMLRQKAKLLGTSYDEVAQSAINMKKELTIAGKVDLDGLSESSRALVTSLAEVKAGGVITIDLPNFDEKGADLATLMNNNEFITKLEEYKKLEEKAEDANPALLQLELNTIAKQQQSTLQVMSNTLISISNQGIKQFEKDGAGLKLLKGYQDPEFSGEKTTLETQITTQFETIALSVATFVTNMKTMSESMVTASILMAGSLATILQNELDTTTYTYPTPSPTAGAGPYPSVSDAFVPGNGQSFVQTGNYGDFFTSKGDEMVIGPGISDFFKNYNQEMNMLKNIEIPNNSKTLTEYQTANASPKENLTDLLTKNSNPYNKNESTGSDNNLEILKNLFNTKIETINKQTVDIGGQTNISVDISSNLPSGVLDLVDKTKLKEKVMSIINERLSVGFGDKLSNALIPQKRG